MARIVSIVLLAALAASPAAASLCRVGAAPDCCPDVQDGHGPMDTDGASLSARACDCCLTVDALPYDRSASISRPLFGTVPIALRPESPGVPPRVTRSTEPVSTAGAGDSRLLSHRTVVLLV